MSPKNPDFVDEDLDWKMSTCKSLALELKQRAMYTPDMKLVEDFEWHLVFIDNIFKSSAGKQGNFLSGSKYLGRAVTTSSDFEMKMTKDYPITFYRRSAIASRKVIGELYAVTPEGLRNLDVVFGNTHMWCRERQFITCEEQLVPFKQGAKRVTIEAWYYLGIEQAFKDMRLNYADTTLHGSFMAYDWDPNGTFVND